MDTLAKRLKYARKACGLTQVQLAALSGIKQPDISKIERGEILKTTALLALARAMHRNPHWLDTGDGPELENDTNHGAHQAHNSRAPYLVPQVAEPTLAITLASLAGYFSQMDDDTKRMAVSLIGDLAKAPDTHVTVTQMIELAMSRAAKQTTGGGV